MSALTNFQAGQTYPPIATSLLASIANGLNRDDAAAIGGPPATPHIIEAIVDAVTALDQQLNG